MIPCTVRAVLQKRTFGSMAAARANALAEHGHSLPSSQRLYFSREFEYGEFRAWSLEDIDAELIAEYVIPWLGRRLKPKTHQGAAQNEKNSAIADCPGSTSSRPER